MLRRKITDRGLACPDVRLSDEVAVRVLIEHGVVAAGDLRLLADPAWCSRQEDLWWTRELRVARRRTGQRLPGAGWMHLERRAGGVPVGSGGEGTRRRVPAAEPPAAEPPAAEPPTTGHPTTGHPATEPPGEEAESGSVARSVIRGDNPRAAGLASRGAAGTRDLRLRVLHVRIGRPASAARPRRPAGRESRLVGRSRGARPWQPHRSVSSAGTPARSGGSVAADEDVHHRLAAVRRMTRAPNTTVAPSEKTSRPGQACEQSLPARPPCGGVPGAPRVTVS